MADVKKESYKPPALRRFGNFEELTQKVLNLSEVARYLHIHRSTAYRMVQGGELPGFKIGSDWRFNLEEIDNWRLSRSSAMVNDRTGGKNGQPQAAKSKEAPSTRRS